MRYSTAVLLAVLPVLFASPMATTTNPLGPRATSSLPPTPTNNPNAVPPIPKVKVRVPKEILTSTAEKLAPSPKVKIRAATATAEELAPSPRVKARVPEVAVASTADKSGPSPKVKVRDPQRAKEIPGLEPTRKVKARTPQETAAPGATGGIVTTAKEEEPSPGVKARSPQQGEGPVNGGGPVPTMVPPKARDIVLDVVL